MRANSRAVYNLKKAIFYFGVHAAWSNGILHPAERNLIMNEARRQGLTQSDLLHLLQCLTMSYPVIPGLDLKMLRKCPKGALEFARKVICSDGEMDELECRFLYCYRLLLQSTRPLTWWSVLSTYESEAPTVEALESIVVVRMVAPSPPWLSEKQKRVLALATRCLNLHQLIRRLGYPALEVLAHVDILKDCALVELRPAN